MTARPSFARTSSSSRPLSAIYIGSVSKPSHIPDLPEPPPSPGAEVSSGSESGLPSPPATNSTGSGSTGDDTTNFGSVRQRPASYEAYSSPTPHSSSSSHTLTSMHNGSPNNSRTTTQIQEDDEDDEHDNDNDEDNTARLDRRRSLKDASENLMALQRVKSLTQRNRMVSRHLFLIFFLCISCSFFFENFLTALAYQHVLSSFDSDALIALFDAYNRLPPTLSILYVFSYCA